MRVLITGGAGFIGSHLAEEYLEHGDEVYLIDDLSTGSLENIRHLQQNENLSGRLFVTVDTVLNREKMIELVGTCDVVFHLAAAVGVRFILDNPLDSIITNVRGTEMVLEVCHLFKKRVLIASTSEVYGKHMHAPLVETDNCIYGPSSKFRWSYAAAKLIDEFTALAYHRTKGLPVIVCRLFNTVGPRQSGEYGMVLPRFVQKALAGEAITVYGDGTQTRTFTHVRDVVAAFTRLILTQEAYGEVVNVGGVEEISILRLAEKIREKSGSASPIHIIPYDQAYPRDFEDMQRRVPSVDKLRQLTGFAPTMCLDGILDDVVDHFRKGGPP
ncbi:MAG: GDP-mannose 4,6-dehydratase [Magnetococcales bacterium]|nr:GDP-mannose 4,6-dehydratase [Magnetococcales bacterium]MBF0157479.1 GDP-mannose 4,6-dehydratase [Magnetococcales bacterium]